MLGDQPFEQALVFAELAETFFQMTGGTQLWP